MYTPNPSNVDDIMRNARNRFGGLLLCNKNEELSIDEYFSEYDYFEKYEEDKSYSKRIYQAAYKGVLREYQNWLYILESDKYEYYVIAKKIYNDLESLEKYCPCLKCSASFLNPMKHIWCIYCTSCIKTGKFLTKEEYIIQARTLKDKDQNNNKLGECNLFKSYKYLKITETSIIILSILIIVYWLYFK